MEGALLFALAGSAGAAAVDAGLRRSVLEGLASAWAASTVGACALILARPVSAKAFWWAFGAGMALRAGVLAALMWRLWSAAPDRQGAVLGAYALGVLGFLLIEYRNF